MTNPQGTPVHPLPPPNNQPTGSPGSVETAQATPREDDLSTLAKKVRLLQNLLQSYKAALSAHEDCLNSQIEELLWQIEKLGATQGRAYQMGGDGDQSDPPPGPS